MLENVRYCVLSSTWNRAKDRFMSDNDPGYTPTELIHLTGKVDGLTGIELIHPHHVRPDNIEEIKTALAETGLDVATIAASISSQPQFRGGSLMADNPAVRREAIEIVMTSMDLAVELGTDKVNVWLGRDGFDYPFQIDYGQAWNQLVEAFHEIGSHCPEIKVSIGYKLREPRKWLLANTAAKTILLAEATGLANVGVLVDNGHTVWGRENMAEVVSLSSQSNRLFHVHFNDNTGHDDDDMVVGSVHFLELMEMLYWLDRVGYEGWISFDPHVFVEDATRVIEECQFYTQGMIHTMERIGKEAIEQAIATRQVTEIMALVRKQLFH